MNDARKLAIAENILVGEPMPFDCSPDQIARWQREIEIFKRYRRFFERITCGRNQTRES